MDGAVALILVDMTQPIQFQSKAKTLSALRGHVKSADIAPIFSCKVGEWLADRTGIIGSISRQFGAQPLIVRSSCAREDGLEQSNAGAFLSLLNVRAAEVAEAIDRVIDSYGVDCSQDEVLVQPMLDNVLRSGVAFSHDPNTCSPYRVISWSEGSNTAAVTGGAQARTWQQAALSQAATPKEIAPVLSLLEELLQIFGGQPVDCEFAMTREKSGIEKVWLLQARPLILPGTPWAEKQQYDCLLQVEAKIAQAMRPHPFVMGKSTVFGVMPDWNPAEIVGVRPKPLALSLYRELITDAIWAYQRHNYGYRNLRSCPLMQHFFGKPYVDVRLSFNSFIPADLDEGLAGRLVDHYIDRLMAEPTLHDKVEFEIVFSCYTMDLPDRLRRLSEFGFSSSEQFEIADSLRKLTNKILHPKEGLWRTDAAKLEVLQKRRAEVLKSDLDEIEKIYWLIEDCKRYGTLPFAGLARAGFIAVQMLKSLVAVGVLSQDDYDSFMGSVNTVSTQLGADLRSLSKAEFLARYGHLRPGTYDILSPRYDEEPDLYFDWGREQAQVKAQSPFVLSSAQYSALARLLSHHGLASGVEGLLDFLRSGIELRELAKFHFTRNLSDALSLIDQWGRKHGLTREDMAYSDIGAFRELYVGAVDKVDTIRRSIELGRARYQQTRALSLPPLISDPKQVWGFEWPETTPNYITQKQVTARVAKQDARHALNGAIVCIPNADPGYDWLFSYPIAGLVTAWGGANSHMAIRAGEMGLPAVIGAGERLYLACEASKRLHIDCAGKKIEILL